MKKVFTTALLAIGFFGASFTVNAGTPVSAGTTVTSRDTVIVQAICDDSLAVQRIAEMANQRSQNIRVKEVCQKLALGYGNTRLQFCATSQALGQSLIPQLGVPANRAMEKLEGLSGLAFDKAAAHELVKSQQPVLRKLQDESAQSAAAPLKHLADSSLAPLQDDIYQTLVLEFDLNMAAIASNRAPRGELASKP
jgi:predicted outer membrane protein